eukprot:COSAG01_NODE_181_length_22873_cov_12.951392_25_plen_125_part_00
MLLWCMIAYPGLRLVVFVQLFASMRPSCILLASLPMFSGGMGLLLLLSPPAAAADDDAAAALPLAAVAAAGRRKNKALLQDTEPTNSSGTSIISCADSRPARGYCTGRRAVFGAAAAPAYIGSA